MTSDEEYYLVATKEAKGEERLEALWAKSITLSDGDSNKAIYKYIRLRVEQLKKLPASTNNTKTNFTKKTVDEFSLMYMPIGEFSKIKRIHEKKIIEMIKDGFYMGQMKNGEWFVNRQEITKEDISSRVSASIQKKQNKVEYIPVEEFAKYKDMNLEKAIEMIREGFYVGKMIDEKWYVSFSEVGGSSEKLAESLDLKNWVKLLLYAQVVISVIAIISGVMQHEFLLSLKSDNFTPEASAIAAAESNDFRQSAIGILQFIIFIMSGIVILKWIHRANFNARNLGATDMVFTPGWSIGWYFVPIVNLWKPYQAMKEIWKASKSPLDWKSEIVPSLLSWWWFLWITSSLISYAWFKLAMRAEELNEFISANIVMLLSDAAVIPLSLVLLAIVKQIYDFQQSHHTDSI